MEENKPHRAEIKEPELVKHNFRLPQEVFVLLREASNLSMSDTSKVVRKSIRKFVGQVGKYKLSHAPKEAGTVEFSVRLYQHQLEAIKIYGKNDDERLANVLWSVLSIEIGRMRQNKTQFFRTKLIEGIDYNPTALQKAEISRRITASC